MKSQKNHLEKSLGPFLLWGLGVGYVISGIYFGWNLGLPSGGTLGMGVATLVVILLYLSFTFSYTELACMIPKAGGAFDYAKEAGGNLSGYVAGTSQLVEFLFAPPAISAAIGAYFHIFLPEIPAIWFAVLVYVIFTGINILGVKTAAIFELFLTIVAVAELIFFASLTLPHFSWQQFSKDPLPLGWMGAIHSLPFALWFFLAIEGVANVAEETRNPQKNILLGFGSALITLVLLCILTYFSAIGVDGWKSIVYVPGESQTSDSPLPLALSHLYQNNALVLHLVISIGLFGLVASFHGILLAAGRATYEFSKAGFLPKRLSEIHRDFHTPSKALLFNFTVGIIAIFSGKTSELIVLASIGATSLYGISMWSFFQLRKKQANRERPFRVPLGYTLPVLAFLLSTGIFLLLAYEHFYLFSVFVCILVLGLMMNRRKFTRKGELPNV